MANGYVVLSIMIGTGGVLEMAWGKCNYGRHFRLIIPSEINSPLPRTEEAVQIGKIMAIFAVPLLHI